MEILEGTHRADSESDKEVGDEDKIFLMQASVCTSEKSRREAMMLCKELRLRESYKAWTRALGIGQTDDLWKRREEKRNQYRWELEDEREALRDSETMPNMLMTNKQKEKKEKEVRLHTSAMGRVEEVRVLLFEGVDKDCVGGRYGSTPLLRAAMGDYIDVVQVLIEAGADINKGDADGWVPLHWAVGAGMENVVMLLIDAGANINPKDESGMTPLHHAAQDGNERVVKVLIESGADIQEADNDGLFPMHRATLMGHENVAKLFKDAMDAMSMPIPPPPPQLENRGSSFQLAKMVSLDGEYPILD